MIINLILTCLLIVGWSLNSCR